MKIVGQSSWFYKTWKNVNKREQTWTNINLFIYYSAKPSLLWQRIRIWEISGYLIVGATRVKTRNMSAVKWVALVTRVFLSCYRILVRWGHKCTDDFHYKLPVQVINSGLNPIAYAFFKRDIKQEFKRLLFKWGRWFTTEHLLCKITFGISSVDPSALY